MKGKVVYWMFLQRNAMHVYGQVSEALKLQGETQGCQSFMSTPLFPYHNVNYFENVTELINEL